MGIFRTLKNLFKNPCKNCTGKGMFKRNCENCLNYKYSDLYKELLNDNFVPREESTKVLKDKLDKIIGILWE